MKSIFSCLQRCRWQYSYIFIRYSCCCVRNLRNPAKFSENSNLYSSGSSKVIDPGVNRKCICNFLLVINSNFERISYSFYPRDAMLARVIAIATCPSVCLSVTRLYCVKTKKASSMISSPSGSPKTLVFLRQISSPNSKGFPRTGASNKGRSEKFSDFLATSVNISKTVGDTAKVTISD